MLAAAGRYRAALDEIAPLTGGAPDLASAAHRLRASVWRQLACYDRAEADGRRALALLSEVPAGPVRDELLVAATAGHVADAVGRLQAGDRAADAELDGRLARAEVALRRLPAGGAQRWRHATRLAWVAGEVALTRGRTADARNRFEEAHTAAAAVGGRRHAAKSAVFLAAAAAAAGDPERVEVLARGAAEDARELGAAPLRWPALLICAEVRFTAGDATAGAALQAQAAVVLRGCLAGLPEDVLAVVQQAPPAAWLLARG